MKSLFLVTAEWVATHLNDPELVLVDARMSPVGLLPKRDMSALHQQGHLPGAVFFDIDAISDQHTTLPHMLPTASDFAAAMSQLGINDQQTIVVYDDGNMFSAPRVWWTFRLFGAQQVKVLDGGLTHWQAQGYALEQGRVTRPHTHFHTTFNADSVVNSQQVLDAVRQGTPQILDARSAGRFAGVEPEPRPGLWMGHIPGSINIPYSDLTDNGLFKSKAELTALFQHKGVDLTQPIIASCGSGVTAAALTLALHSLGANKVMLYDGAWSEWGAQDKQFPVAKGSN